MKTLLERLEDWTDLDWAQYELGVVLGAFPDDDLDNPGIFFRENKHVFWTNNHLCDVLYAALMGLKEEGLLEYDAEDLRLRAVKCSDGGLFKAVTLDDIQALPAHDGPAATVEQMDEAIADSFGKDGEDEEDKSMNEDSLDDHYHVLCLDCSVTTDFNRELERGSVSCKSCGRPLVSWDEHTAFRLDGGNLKLHAGPGAKTVKFGMGPSSVMLDIP